MKAARQFLWLRITAGLLVLALAAATWKWAPTTATDLQEFAAWIAPHRHAWYTLPVVMIAFIALGLAMVPVILLIGVTGIAFGPILGPLYAMAGCLASAATGFGIGRWMGLGRVEKMGGARVGQVTRALKRNGILAVFLIRKLPVAPFTVVNIVAGASPVHFRDFILGTALGMGAFVVVLAGFGHQLLRALQDPSPGMLGGAAIFLGVPLTMAWLINRAFRRARSVG